MIIEPGEAGIFDFNLSLVFLVMPGITIGTLAIVAGKFAIQRRRWRLAYAASASASFVLVGIPALILLNKYKKEFGEN